MRRFVQTGSRWGNVYRSRYYIDGKQVSRDVFDEDWAGVPKETRDAARKYINTNYGYRIDWHM